MVLTNFHHFPDSFVRILWPESLCKIFIFTCRQRPALRVYFSPLCTYWPFHCSHSGMAHVGVTDSESKLKTWVGIKGHCFIRMIHSNTINLTPALGEGRLSTGEKEGSQGFSIYSPFPLWIFFPQQLYWHDRQLKTKERQRVGGVSFLYMR